MEVNLNIAADAASVMPLIIICDILIIIAWKILGAKITSLSGGGHHLSGSVELEEKEGRTYNGGYPLLILLIVVVDGLILFSSMRSHPVEEESSPVAAALTSTPAPTSIPEQGQEKTEETSGPVPTPYVVQVLSDDTLTTSGQKAVTRLLEQAKEGCPLSVYDPKGTEQEEKDFLYDNALAALALLSQGAKNRKDTSAEVQAILDGILSDGSGKTGSLEGIAYTAIALLQYDKLHTSVKYVKAAQDLLDSVLETRKNEDGGFFTSANSAGRSTAENLLLYSAFQMLYERTETGKYADGARSAEKFIQTMRSADGSYYLAGDKADHSGAVLSAKVQALAELILNDPAGMKKAESLWGSKGGFLPDDGASSGEGFSSESTLLMELAYQKLGQKDKIGQGISAVTGCQMDRGGVMEASVNSMKDSSGTLYKNVPRTAVTAWYVLVVEKKNPFDYGIA